MIYLSKEAHVLVTVAPPGPNPVDVFEIGAGGC